MRSEAVLRAFKEYLHQYQANGIIQLQHKKSRKFLQPNSTEIKLRCTFRFRSLTSISLLFSYFYFLDMYILFLCP